MYETKYDHIPNVDLDKYYQKIEDNKLKRIYERKKLVEECLSEATLILVQFP